MNPLVWHAAGFVTLVALLLVLLARDRMGLGWRLLLTLAATTAYFAHYHGISGLAGWPRPAPLPESFDLLGSRVEEPRPGSGGDGFIELWIRPENADTSRLYRLQYDRELAVRVGRAAERLERGRAQVGRGGGSAAASVSFGDRPPNRLPPKQ